jgi:hypothetical protein
MAQTLHAVVVVVQLTEIFAEIINFVDSILTRNDHTMMTAPLLVCSVELSIIGPG